MEDPKRSSPGDRWHLPSVYATVCMGCCCVLEEDWGSENTSLKLKILINIFKMVKHSSYSSEFELIMGIKN